VGLSKNPLRIVGCIWRIQPRGVTRTPPHQSNTLESPEFAVASYLTLIMSTMRAARVTEFKKPYEIEEIEIPKPKANQLLVKTGAAGFCHTGNFLWMS